MPAIERAPGAGVRHRNPALHAPNTEAWRERFMAWREEAVRLMTNDLPGCGILPGVSEMSFRKQNLMNQIQLTKRQGVVDDPGLHHPRRSETARTERGRRPRLQIAGE